MPAIFAAVSISTESGIPEDTIVNTFSFANTAGGAPGASDIDDVFTLLVNFYNTKTGAQAQPLCYYLSSLLSRDSGGVLVQMYDPDGPYFPLLGPPIAEPVFTLGAPSATHGGLPSEVAACLSFHATRKTFPEHGPGGSRPKATRRGRVFLGPLNAASTAGGSAVTPMVTSAPFRTDACTAADQMRTDSQSRDMPWRVWSRKMQTSAAVMGGWMDDALDTVRSRGPAPTLRTTFGDPNARELDGLAVVNFGGT